MGILESEFQHDLIVRLENDIGSDGYVLNLDGAYIQGFPDILILYRGRWAALECKRRANSPCRPNQKYYIDHLDELSFASFIHPGNEEEVLNDLYKEIRLRRSRISKS